MLGQTQKNSHKSPDLQQQKMGGGGAFYIITSLHTIFLPLPVINEGAAHNTLKEKPFPRERPICISSVGHNAPPQSIVGLGVAKEEKKR